MDKTKDLKKIPIIFIFLLLIFIPLGLYGSSFVALKILGASESIALRYDTIFELLKVLTIKNKAVAAGAAILGLCLLIPFVFSIGILFSTLFKKKSLHGDAKDVTTVEIRKANLVCKSIKDLENTSKQKYPDVLIGTMRSGALKGKYLRSSSNTPISVIARSRSGKGVSFVIPNLLNYTDSVVVYDPKSELYKKTAAWRKTELKHEIYLFSPDGFAFTPEDQANQIAYSHKWNVFDNVREGAYTATDLSTIASIFFPTNDEIWNSSAANLFVGLAGYLLHQYRVNNKHDIYPSITEVINLKASPDLKDLISLVLLDDNMPQYIKNNLSNYISTADKTRQGINATFDSKLSIFNNPVTVAATSGKSDIDFTQLRRRKMGVYFVINPNSIDSYTALVNLFFTMTIVSNMDFQPDEDSSLKHQVLLMIDEFATLGKMPIIASSITHISGYNIRLALIFQDVAQIKDDKLYGKGAETLLSGCDVETCFPPKMVNEEAERLSKAFGEYTFKNKEISRQSGTGGTSTTRNTRLEKRALYLPQEIVKLGHQTYKNTDIASKSIIIKDKINPFIADKIIYFDDPTFKERENFAIKNFNQLKNNKLNFC